MATILVVDDELVFCELLKTLLKSHGHNVLTANDGRQALQVFKNYRPQFTMLDLRMPEMSGLEVLRQIRAIDTKAAVMILTAWGTDALELQARKLGVTDFLSKTLSLDTIVESLQRGLAQPVQPTVPTKPAQPAVKQPAQPTATATPATDKEVAPFGTLEANTILVIDSKREARDLFSRYLTQHGFQVRVALDGPTALALAEKEKPQLIVLDMEIPGMSGVEVLRTLRNKRYTGGVIMMTGTQHGKLLKEAVDLGSVDILGKPVEPERLMLAIQVGLVLLR